jgi:hypothetical protein
MPPSSTTTYTSSIDQWPTASTRRYEARPLAAAPARARAHVQRRAAPARRSWQRHHDARDEHDDARTTAAVSTARRCRRRWCSSCAEEVGGGHDGQRSWPARRARPTRAGRPRCSAGCAACARAADGRSAEQRRRSSACAAAPTTSPQHSQPSRPVGRRRRSGRPPHRSSRPRCFSRPAAARR